MKSNQKWNVLLGLALCLTATSVKAADVVGSFTLPFQAHWGQATLPAGHYTFTLDQSAGGGQKIITLSQGTKAIAMILAQGYSQASSTDRSSMLIVEQRVRSLHLAAAGVTYYFPAHKGERELLARRPAAKGVAVVPVSAK